MSYHCSGIPMKAPHFIFIAWLLSHSNASLAFESDVHFGLTQWLALQAGFDEFAARTIATGDQRVDSGDMQFLDLELMYACLGKDDVGARRAGTHHYPTDALGTEEQDTETQLAQSRRSLLRDWARETQRQARGRRPLHGHGGGRARVRRQPGLRRR